MARLNLDAAKRHAAGHACLVVFHVLSSGVIHPLKMIADPRLRETSMAAGLTLKEVELIQRKTAELADYAELFRKLGWRLLR